MTPLMKKLIEKLRAIPEEEQDGVAGFLLEDLRHEERWDELFADSRSEKALSRMTEEALREHETGESEPLEDFLKRKK